jgi:hypothetical protein
VRGRDALALGDHRVAQCAGGLAALGLDDLRHEVLESGRDAGAGVEHRRERLRGGAAQHLQRQRVRDRLAVAGRHRLLEQVQRRLVVAEDPADRVDAVLHELALGPGGRRRGL